MKNKESSEDDYLVDDSVSVAVVAAPAAAAGIPNKVIVEKKIRNKTTPSKKQISDGSGSKVEIPEPKEVLKKIPNEFIPQSNAEPSGPVIELLSAENSPKEDKAKASASEQDVEVEKEKKK